MPRHHHHHHHSRSRGPADPLSTVVGFVLFGFYLLWLVSTRGGKTPAAPVFPDVQAQWNAFINNWTTWLLNLTLNQRLLIGGGIGVVMLALMGVLVLLYWQTTQSSEAEHAINSER